MAFAETRIIDYVSHCEREESLQTGHVPESSDGPLGAVELPPVRDHDQPSCLTVVGLPLTVRVSLASSKRTASIGAVRSVACSLLCKRPKLIVYMASLRAYPSMEV